MTPGQNVVAGTPGVSVSQEFTRPADTTAYAALDTIANSTSLPTVLTFAGMGRDGTQYGLITKARLNTDQKTCTARFRLHLFNAAPSPINDNSPYLTLYANRNTKIGAIDFAACGTEDPTNSTTAGALNTSTMLPYVTAAGATVLYGILETLDAFTPANAQNFYIQLTAELG